MTFEQWAAKLRRVAVSHNAFLGALLCYSCRRHDRFSAYDKVVSLDRDTELYVHSDGRVEVMCVRDDLGDLLVAIAEEVRSASADQLTLFGDGVAVRVFGAPLECTSCGSQEFQKLTADSRS